jgi:hypothetical protein
MHENFGEPIAFYVPETDYSYLEGVYDLLSSLLRASEPEVYYA